MHLDMSDRSHYVERREDCKAVICPTNAQRSGETAATDGLRMGSANDSLLAADRRCSSVDLENIISPWVIPFASIVSLPPLIQQLSRGDSPVPRGGPVTMFLHNCHGSLWEYVAPASPWQNSKVQ